MSAHRRKKVMIQRFFSSSVNVNFLKNIQVWFSKMSLYKLRMASSKSTKSMNSNDGPSQILSCQETCDEFTEDEAKNDLSFSSLVGNTPLTRVKKLLAPHGYKCQMYAKCEFKNPSGSSWDRLVVGQLRQTLSAHGITPRTNFITGGNGDLCLSLAWAGAAGDFPVTILPGLAVDEKKLTLARSLGANVVLSYRQDTLAKQTFSTLVSHMDRFEDVSGISHHRVIPVPMSDAASMYESLPEEISKQMQISGGCRKTDATSGDFDIVVCGGENKGLVYALARKYLANANKNITVLGVDFSSNSFGDKASDDISRDLTTAQINGKSVKWVSVSDGAAYDMARRLIREEGLMVGPMSGAVMAAAISAIDHLGLGNTNDSRILVVLTDSLANSSQNFLSLEWMIQQGYYETSILESLYWWYEMAIENMSPPVPMTVPPNASVKSVLGAMIDTKTERVVVVDGSTKNVMGVVSYGDLCFGDIPGNTLIKNICSKNFGIIDSNENFSSLEPLLRQFNWVVIIQTIAQHRVNKSQELVEGKEIIGVINLADFMKYKKEIENHHLTEYKLAMSDGIPSGVWLESFKASKLTEKGWNEKVEL